MFHGSTARCLQESTVGTRDIIPGPDCAESTVMLHHTNTDPCSLTSSNSSRGACDFLLMDCENGRDMGYVFINFWDVEACLPSENFVSVVLRVVTVCKEVALPRNAELPMPASRDWKGVATC